MEGLVLAMDTQGSKGEIYNLGNPDEYKIIELAEKIKSLTHSSSDIKTTQSLPEGDPQRRCPDISKAKLKLGWEPKISLEEGLKKLIEYLKG